MNNLTSAEILVRREAIFQLLSIGHSHDAAITEVESAMRCNWKLAELANCCVDFRGLEETWKIYYLYNDTYLDELKKAVKAKIENKECGYSSKHPFEIALAI